jgi:hypothetical protein
MGRIWEELNSFDGKKNERRNEHKKNCINCFGGKTKDGKYIRRIE